MEDDFTLVIIQQLHYAGRMDGQFCSGRVLLHPCRGIKVFATTFTSWSLHKHCKREDGAFRVRNGLIQGVPLSVREKRSRPYVLDRDTLAYSSKV